MKRTNKPGQIFSLAILMVFTLMAAVSFAREISDTTANGWNAPETAKAVENPISTETKAVETGKKLFAQQCATCHGNSGKGDGPAGKYLGKPLPDFTTAEFQEQTDGEIFWKITTGKAPMPTFEKMLTDEQRWQVINFIRSLSTED